jgi:hypothetical protein
MNIELNFDILARAIYSYSDRTLGIHFPNHGPVTYRRRLQKDANYLKLILAHPGIMRSYERRMENFAVRSFLNQNTEPT